MSNPFKTLEDLTEEEYQAFIAKQDELSALKLSPEEWDKMLFDNACKLVQEHDLITADVLQLNLYTGYATATRLIGELESAGLIARVPGSLRLYAPVR